MDSRQLRAFVVLAELGHFGRAADRLGITQPALTKRIHALETMLGGALFVRDQRGATLTVFGKLLQPDAMRIATETDALTARALSIAQGRAGRLDIGFGLSAIETAPRLIAAFRQAYPDVTIALNDYSSADQLDRLATGDLDIGFLRLPADSTMATRPLFEDRLAIVVPAAWPALEVDALESLNRTGFVMLAQDRGAGLARQIAHWSERAGFMPRVIQWADDIQTVLALVSAGGGYSILPASSASLMQAGIRLTLLEGDAARWTVGAAWQPDRANPALRNFVAMIEEGMIAS